MRYLSRQKAKWPSTKSSIPGGGFGRSKTWRQRQASPPAPAPHWRRSGGPPLSRRAEVIALVLVLVLGFALRGILLRDAPAKIDPDEGRQGRYAERIWENGFPNAFDIGWNVFPHLSYMVEELKPDSAYFQTALNRFGLAPDECHFFDDTYRNIMGARRLGIPATVVPKGGLTRALVAESVQALRR